MKKLFSMLLVLVLGASIAAFAACGKDDTGLAGTYEFHTMIYDGQTFEIGDEAPWGDTIFTKEFFTLTMNKNGTWSSVAVDPAGGDDVTDNGTWTYEDGVLEMISSVTSANFGATIDGDVISMTQNFGMEVTYTFKKA